jgi:hypothetical protein
MIISSVSDPHWFQCGSGSQHLKFNADLDTDPDPEFLLTKKKIQLKNFFDQKLKFIYPKSSIQNVQARGEEPSALKREHSALQNMKFLKNFALLDQGPNWECGSGNR